MFESLLKALAAGLSLWESKERTKYIDRIEKIKREYYEEAKKDPSVRSDAVLDDLRFQLCIAADSFYAAAVGAKNPANK